MAKGMSSEDVYASVTNRIMDALRGETIPWDKLWQGESLAHRNMNSGRVYRGVLNQILLSLGGFGSPYWLTFNGAKKLGGKIRKGEKSTVLAYWNVIVPKEDRAKPKDEQRRIPILGYVRVFNVEQTEGIEIPTVETPADHDPIAEAQAIMDGMPNAPKLDHNGGDRAFYNPARDSVSLPFMGAFKSAEAYYSVAFHELVHATGHKSRLNREGVTGAISFGSENYSREELVAEMGSAMLCAVAGIDKPLIENQAAYIQGWLKSLEDDPKMVVWAAGRASKAANYIRDIQDEEDAVKDD